MKPDRIVALVILAVAGFLAWQRPAWLAGGRGHSPDLERAALTRDLGGIDERVGQAIGEARAAVQRTPGSPDTWARLGLTLEANGLPGLAADCYTELIRFDVRQEKWWYRIAVCHTSASAIEEAADAMRRAIELDDGFAPAHWRLGYVLLDRGELEQAKMSFERAVTLDPEDAAGWIGLGRTHLQQADVESGLEALERALRLRPRDRYVLGLLGRVYREAGRWEEAERTARAGGGSEPVLVDPLEEEVLSFEVDAYHARLTRAKQAMARGRTADAVPLLEELVSERSQDVALLQLLAQAYVESGRLQDARESYATCLRLQPNGLWTLLNLASLAVRTGAEEEAHGYLDRLLRVRPTFGPGHEIRAGLLRAQGRSEEALAAYRAAQLYDARNPLLSIQAGQLELALGRHEEAAETFRSALEQAPGLPAGVLGLARALIEGGELGAAEEALESMRESPEAVERAQELRNRIEELRAGGPEADR